MSLTYAMLSVAKLDILITNYSPGQRIKLSTGERDVSTNFPRYLKVERFYETFHEWKWRKAKKQSALTYLEKILSIPRPKK